VTSDSTRLFIIIPAFQPDKTLITLINQMIKLDKTTPIIVVNDGSDPALKSTIFEQIEKLSQVHVIEHTVNLGKGDALKTGFNYYLSLTSNRSPGVVTADADGQHKPEDIVKLCQHLTQQTEQLHLGIREFGGENIPLRSKFGNILTRFILNFTNHISLRDTQTGLRAIPRQFVKHLVESKLSGYEFELEMLIQASEQHIAINEIEITTVYSNGNKTSHFKPIWDSLKIYFVFIRFASISLLSALLDLSLFSISFYIQKNIILSIAIGRIVSGCFNYKMNQRIAFKKAPNYLSVVKYAALVVTLGGASYVLLHTFHSTYANVYISKIMAETTLFIFSFGIQRFFVFKSSDKVSV
jgi:glycosyltransferase involved in cell wall biosynthesis